MKRLVNQSMECKCLVSKWNGVQRWSEPEWNMYENLAINRKLKKVNYHLERFGKLTLVLHRSKWNICGLLLVNMTVWTNLPLVKTWWHACEFVNKWMEERRSFHVDRMYLFEKRIFVRDFCGFPFAWCKAANYRVVVAVMHHGNTLEFTSWAKPPFLVGILFICFKYIKAVNWSLLGSYILNRISINASLTNIVLKIKPLGLVIRLSRDPHIKSLPKRFKVENRTAKNSLRQGIWMVFLLCTRSTTAWQFFSGLVNFFSRSFLLIYST